VEGGEVNTYSVYVKDLPNKDSHSVHIVQATSRISARRMLRDAYAMHFVPANGYEIAMFTAIKIFPR
jgi:hypothetical protein